MAEEPVIPDDLNIMFNEIESVADGRRCIKLGLPLNISAFFNNQELDRDIEKISCDQDLLEKITSNYVIVKKIISFLPWQDKLICKNVCSMWRSAVNALKREQLSPADFAISLKLGHIRNGIKLEQTGNFYTEPLLVLAFANTSGFAVSRKCEILVPCPCDPTCSEEHFLVDVVKYHVALPKNCMLAVKACYLSYKPLPRTLTYQHTINHEKFGRFNAFIGGIYIPAIPDIEFKVINLRCPSDMKRAFFRIVDRLSETHYIKGILVFVNESFLLHTVEDIVFLNYFREVQKDVPYALGGCIVEDTVSTKDDMDVMIESVNGGLDLNTENLVSIGLFTIPKELYNKQPEHGCNFDMFSLIIESSDWSKAKIQSSINEFSKRVPRFEHSVVIKLSCVGRDQKHNYEQDFFRAAFPNTRLIGCYGNGELGVNKPERPPPPPTPGVVKRHRRDPGPQFGVMYSYSTVFVYIGWGKITAQPECT